MKGEKTLEILELIGGVAVNLLDLTAAFLNAGYGASPGKIQYELDKLRGQRWDEKAKRENKREEILLEKQRLQRFYEILCRLEKDGLLEKTVESDKAFLTLTSKGKSKIDVLRARKENALPNFSYNASPGGKFIIITFDIPEAERRKRNWLREVLKNLGFKFIQKSVWLGKIKIPQEFLEDLRKFKLIEFVEIFEISKTGSLRQIS